MIVTGASAAPRIRRVAAISWRGASMAIRQSRASIFGWMNSLQAFALASLARRSLMLPAISWRGAPRRRAWFCSYQLETSSMLGSGGAEVISSKSASGVTPLSAAAASTTCFWTRSRIAFLLKLEDLVLRLLLQFLEELRLHVCIEIGDRDRLPFDDERGSLILRREGRGPC